MTLKFLVILLEINEILNWGKTKKFKFDIRRNYFYFSLAVKGTFGEHFPDKPSEKCVTIHYF